MLTLSGARRSLRTAARAARPTSNSLSRVKLAIRDSRLYTSFPVHRRRSPGSCPMPQLLSATLYFEVQVLQKGGPGFSTLASIEHPVTAIAGGDGSSFGS